MSDLSNTKDTKTLSNVFFEIMLENPFLLELFPSPIYFIKDDSDMTVICGNSLFYTLFGCSVESMRHKYANRLSALIFPESLKYFYTLTKKNVTIPIHLSQHIKQDKKEAWIYTQAIRLPYKGDSIFCCISYDITEQKKQLQHFKKYQEEFKLIAEQVNLDIFEYNCFSEKAKFYNSQSFLLSQIKEAQLKQVNFQDAVLSKKLIHSDDIHTFCNVFTSMKQGNNKVICELRMKTIDNIYNWYRFTLATKQTSILSGQYAVGIFENITEQKEMSLKYLNETQFYQAILTEKTAFAHVNITENRCIRFGGIWNLYNELINTITYSELTESFINKVVHPEDRAHYLELMQKDNFIQSFENGIDKLGCEFRRIVEQNKMLWMELHVHLFKEPFTQHILALVYITNIDEKKKQELALLYDSERDQLTNTFNKRIAETSIRNYIKEMKEDEVGIFMILDLDDFKSINDTYGHRTGDKVLIRLSELLTLVFERCDIIGRFGGDEFIILLKNITCKETVCSQLDRLYQFIESEKNPAFSCSIGISFIHYGDTYEQIFQQADTALYAAKNEGKGHFVFFAEENQKKIHPFPVKKHQSSPSMKAPFKTQPVIEDISFDSFISEQGDLAYLVDPETFLLICGNKAFYERIGMTEIECIGLKCYEAVHKRQSPCPFCSKANWSTDKFYLWRNFNTALEQEFLVKNKLVQWQGKTALLALSIDISNNKSIVDSMNNTATESHNILSGIQRMTEAASLSAVINSAMETIGYFFRSDAVRFFERKNNESPYHCTNVWTKKDRKLNYFGESEINTWLQGQKWGQSIMIESPESMLCYSYDMYQYMERNNIINQRWVQLLDGNTELGCIAIENISSNFQNISFLESFRIFLVEEIKKRKLLETILYSSRYDDLTSLLSRNSYEQYLQKYNSDSIFSIGVMIANIDNLKGINGMKGFLTGNYYLKEFANMLRTTFPSETLFRLNGDEFLAIITDVDHSYLKTCIHKLKNLLKKNGAFTVSIGYSWDNVENDLAILIEQATEAMKVDKKRHYDTGPISVDTERRKMLSELMTAMEKKEFEVFLQPKVELSSNKVIGAEALIRYRHKEMGIIPPSKFIDLLEKNNLIRYIDLFVFEEVCRMLEEWKKAGRFLPIISLNFSRLTLLEQDILSNMEKIISQYDVSRKNIEIEITESVANIGKSILYQAAKELYHAGFSISLDDFGTKYTNLSILADINFDMLKLDKSLIDALVNKNSNQIILKNIIYMCKDLGIDVIAEGVENQDQETILLKLNCKLGQGYLYGKPMPIDEFNEKYVMPK